MNRLMAVFSLLLVATLFSLQSLAKVDPAKLMVEDSYEAPVGRLFNEASYIAGGTYLNEYTNVIVINKASKGPTAQTLRLYVNRQLILTTDVSTGREDVEVVGAVRGVVNKIFKGATSSHWRHTTRGFYTVKRIEGANYKSGESKFHMPYAMFFNENRGLAVHQVPPDLSGGEAAGEAMLGQRASSGCVRVHKNTIFQIHSLVVGADRGHVPVLDTRTGQALRDEYGNVRYQRGYKTLVIVEEY